MASKNTSSKSSHNNTNTCSSSSSVPASSSIADHLFGPKPVTSSSHIRSSSSSSSSTIFGSVFGPSSMGGERNSGDQIGNLIKQYASMPGSNSYYQQQTIDQPCNFSNSIYYGGQEVYSPTTRSSESHVFKKDDKQNDDPNSASRGNWWQGSLYY
ncbi:unnamed protein product [Amaranthus hypochondriacus]